MGSCFAKYQHSEFFLCGFVGHLSLCAMEKKVIFIDNQEENCVQPEKGELRSLLFI